MIASGIVKTFQSHAFLKDLSERHLMVLASGARPFTATAGSYLAREGSSANAFYLIQAGHVALETNVPKRGTVRLQTMGPGEIIGWSWLAPPHRWRFDCVAVDNVQGISFEAHWLREQCECDHELGYHLLRHLLTVLASRLAATRMQLLESSQ
jgi:CRP/FNR family cyclic AMP-dependent transcriptional regulator